METREQQLEKRVAELQSELVSALTFIEFIDEPEIKNDSYTINTMKRIKKVLWGEE